LVNVPDSGVDHGSVLLMIHDDPKDGPEFSTRNALEWSNNLTRTEAMLASYLNINHEDMHDLKAILVYGEDHYYVFVSELIRSFNATGYGIYHGTSLHNWLLTLTDSFVFLDENMVANAQGKIELDVSPNAEDGLFAVSFVDYYNNHVEVALDTGLDWHYKAADVFENTVSFRNLAQYTDKAFANATTNLVYGADRYQYDANEFVYEFSTFGYGTYSGNSLGEWSLVLTDAKAYYKSLFAADMASSIRSNIPAGGLTGLVSVYGSAINILEPYQGSPFDKFLINSAGEWSYDGSAESVLSLYNQLQLDSSVYSNVSAELTFGFDEYSFKAVEYVYEFSTDGYGTYSGTSIGVWSLVLTDAKAYYKSSFAADMAGKIRSDIPEGGATGSLSVYGSAVSILEPNQDSPFDKFLIDSAAQWSVDISAESMLSLYNQLQLDSSVYSNVTGELTFGFYEYTFKAAEYVYEFSTDGYGTYSGASTGVWSLVLTDAKAYYKSSFAADMAASIRSNIPAGGLTGLVSVYGSAVDILESSKDSPFEKFLINSAGQWSYDGSAESAFSLYNELQLDSSVYSNVTGELTFGLDEYAFKAAEYVYEFSTDGYGTYSGTSLGVWSLVLTDAKAYYKSSFAADMAASIQSNIPAGGLTGLVSVYGSAVNILEPYQDSPFDRFLIDSAGHWSYDGSAESVLSLYNQLQLDSAVYSNVTGELTFGLDEYAFKAAEYVYEFSAFGYGTYSGTSLGVWSLVLTDAKAYYKSSFAADMAASIQSNIPAGGLTGLVSVYGSAVNILEPYQDSPFDRFLIDSAGQWSYGSAESVLSLYNQLQLDSAVYSNASAFLQFGDNRFSFAAVEYVYKFLANGAGIYRGSSLSNWLLQITRSLVSLDDAILANTTALVSLDAPSPINAGTFALQGQDIINGKNQFSTETKIAYTYQPAGGIVNALFTSESDLFQDNIYYAMSQFYLNQDERVAWESVQESSYGINYLYAVGTATYNLATGMISTLTGKVNWEGSTLFQIGSSYDAQLKGQIVPTIAPTSIFYVQTLITFELYMTLSGVSADQLDTANANTACFQSTLSPILLPIGPGNIAYSFSYQVGDESSQDLNHLLYYSNTDTSLVTSMITMIFYSTSDLSSSTISSYYVDAVDALSASFADGDFLSSLHINAAKTAANDLVYVSVPSFSVSLSYTVEVIGEAPTSSPTVVATALPSSLPTTQPTYSPTTISPTYLPSAIETSFPSAEPTLSPSSAPSAGPTLSPSSDPSALPTLSPSSNPSAGPTLSPSSDPSAGPTLSPSPAPSTGPTLSPSSAPSEGPTLSPSSDPSTGPTLSPSSAPSEGPTLSPSSDHSVGPTLSPSSAPSAGPTVSPVSVPSFLPTLQPTLAPYSAPTVEPTLSPTLVSSSPSSTPTILPTMMPSSLPSFSPTFSPTSQTSPIVVFSSNITIAGVTTTSLDSASENAIIASTASSMNIPTSAVTYTATYLLASTSVRRLRGVEEGLTLVSPAALRSRLEATSYTVLASTTTSIALSSTSYSSASALYQGLTTLLNSSVSSGDFTVSLEYYSSVYNASATSSATATGVSSSQPLIITQPTNDKSNKDDDNSTAIIAGVVVAVFVLIAASICYWKRNYLRRYCSSSTPNRGDEANEGDVVGIGTMSCNNEDLASSQSDDGVIRIRNIAFTGNPA
jgi:hypothetical protein